MSRSSEDSKLFGTMDERCIALINSLFRFDPAQRLSANEVSLKSLQQVTKLTIHNRRSELASSSSLKTGMRLI